MSSDTTDEEIDRVYDDVDDLMHAGDFARVDALLAALDVDRLTLTMMLAWLTITFVADGELPARRGLYNRVRQRILRTEPERVDALLWGLLPADHT